MLDIFADHYDAEAAPQANEGQDLPTSFGELFADAWQNGQMAVSAIKQENGREQAVSDYLDEIRAAGGGPEIAAEYARQANPNLLWASPPDMFNVADTVASRMKASADAAGKTLPFQYMSSGDIDQRAVQISQAAIGAEARNEAAPQTWGSAAGRILGGLASGATDPYNIPSMAIPLEGLGILGTAAAVGGAQALTQAANEAANAPYNEKISPGYGASGQAVENVIGAGVSGALLGGGVKAAGNVLTRLMTGAWPTAAKDAANGVMSEADILNSNVLPGAEGEAAHQDALAQSIGQILRGDPVAPDIAAASQDVMARAQAEQGFTLPKFDAAEVSRLSEEAELHERSGALTDQLASLPAGDQGAAETLARLQEVERQLGEATTPDARRALSDRRDELLTDTNPETLQAAAAPIEQRRVAMAEQASIADRLDEIQSERSQAQLDQITSGEQAQQPLSQRVPPYQQPTLLDIHTGRIDALMDMREGAVAAGEGSPELAHNTSGIARGVQALAQIGGSDMPPVEAQALARRVVASGTPDEARFILNQVTDRPRTLMATLPSPEDFAEAIKADAANAPRPQTLTAEQISEQLAAPETVNAMRADVERAIDEAAQTGKALQVPIDIRPVLKPSGEPVLEGSLIQTLLGFRTPAFEPVFGSVADELAEIDRYKAMADQMAQCALPGAMQEAAE